MKKLFDLYTGKLKCSEFWSYYSNEVSFDKSIFDKSIFECDEKAFEFIGKYFSRGKKGKLLDFRYDSNIETFIKERATHTVSAFFLGLIIAEYFNINTITRDENNMDFKYYWFLSCLYHDIGYMYEKNTYDNLKMVAQDGFEAIQTLCDIKYIHERIFRTYDKKIIEKYLKFRAECRDSKVERIDHGITGGLMLYDRLRKQFESSWKKRNKLSDTRKSFYIEGSGAKLHLSSDHFDEYAKVANAIIRHNIWKDSFKKAVNYPYCGKRTVFKNIALTDKLEDQLCFVLAIADTIEPIKKYKGIKSDSVLENIGIDLSGNELEICVLSDCLCHDGYYNSIKSLEEWVNISVCTKKNSDNKESIKLKTN